MQSYYVTRYIFTHVAVVVFVDVAEVLVVLVTVVVAVVEVGLVVAVVAVVVGVELWVQPANPPFSNSTSSPERETTVRSQSATTVRNAPIQKNGSWSLSTSAELPPGPKSTSTLSKRCRATLNVAA